MAKEGWYPGKFVEELRARREKRVEREKWLEKMASEEWVVWKNRNEWILRHLPEDQRKILMDEVDYALRSLAKRIG